MHRFTLLCALALAASVNADVVNPPLWADSTPGGLTLRSEIASDIFLSAVDPQDRCRKPEPSRKGFFFLALTDASKTGIVATECPLGGRCGCLAFKSCVGGTPGCLTPYNCRDYTGSERCYSFEQCGTKTFSERVEITLSCPGDLRDLTNPDLAKLAVLTKQALVEDPICPDRACEYQMSSKADVTVVDKDTLRFAMRTCEVRDELASCLDGRTVNVTGTDCVIVAYGNPGWTLGLPGDSCATTCGLVGCADTIKNYVDTYFEFDAVADELGTYCNTYNVSSSPAAPFMTLLNECSISDYLVQSTCDAMAEDAIRICCCAKDPDTFCQLEDPPMGTWQLSGLGESCSDTCGSTACVADSRDTITTLAFLETTIDDQLNTLVLCQTFGTSNDGTAPSFSQGNCLLPETGTNASCSAASATHRQLCCCGDTCSRGPNCERAFAVGTEGGFRLRNQFGTDLHIEGTLTFVDGADGTDKVSEALGLTGTFGDLLDGLHTLGVISISDLKDDTDHIGIQGYFGIDMSFLTDLYFPNFDGGDVTSFLPQFNVSAWADDLGLSFLLHLDEVGFGIDGGAADGEGIDGTFTITPKNNSIGFGLARLCYRPAHDNVSLAALNLPTGNPNPGNNIGLSTDGPCVDSHDFANGTRLTVRVDIGVALRAYIVPVDDVPGTPYISTLLGTSGLAKDILDLVQDGVYLAIGQLHQELDAGFFATTTQLVAEFSFDVEIPDADLGFEGQMNAMPFLGMLGVPPTANFLVRLPSGSSGSTGGLAFDTSVSITQLFLAL